MVAKTQCVYFISAPHVRTALSELSGPITHWSPGSLDIEITTFSRIHSESQDSKARITSIFKHPVTNPDCCGQWVMSVNGWIRARTHFTKYIRYSKKQVTQDVTPRISNSCLKLQVLLHELSVITDEEKIMAVSL